MTAVAIFTLLCLSSSILSFSYAEHSAVSGNFRFVTRREWGARQPARIVPINFPVPFVVIHHTYIPGACFTFQQCAAAMRSMQNFHQNNNGWNDIAYNFAVGSDGAVYEGRGWGVVGSHAIGYNSQSTGIVLIGDWVSAVPPRIQLETTKNLILEGVRLGHISNRYDLIGHRQVTATECPGQALFREISTWDRFRPKI